MTGDKEKRDKKLKYKRKYVIENPDIPWVKRYVRNGHRFLLQKAAIHEEINGYEHPSVVFEDYFVEPHKSSADSEDASWI